MKNTHPIVTAAIHAGVLHSESSDFADVLDRLAHNDPAKAARLASPPSSTVAQRVNAVLEHQQLDAMLVLQCAHAFGVVDAVSAMASMFGVTPATELPSPALSAAVLARLADEGVDADLVLDLVCAFGAAPTRKRAVEIAADYLRIEHERAAAA